jgi:tetratricopeptide (TPR) repeat protein
MVGILKKRWFQFLGVIVFIAAFALIMKLVNRGPDVAPPDIAAEIAGKKITSFQLQVAVNRRMIRQMSTKGSVSAADKEDILLSVFKTLLNDTLLEVFSEQEGVKITDEDRRKKKQGILDALGKKPVAVDSANPPDQRSKDATALEKYEFLWSSQGFRTEDEFLKDLDKEILEEKLSEHLFPEKSYTVSDQEINDYIPTVELQQIYLTYDRSKPQGMEINFSDRKTWDLARNIYAQLKAGADFAQLAKKYSQEIPFNKNGGYIGYVNKRSVVADFWNVASVMKPGEISEPFETQYGIHILKCLNSKRPDDPVFAEYRKVLKRVVLIRKQKSDFGAWFYKQMRSLQEKDKIVLYNHVLKANMLRNMGKFDEAVEEYRKAIASDKEGAPYYHIDVSMIYSKQRKYNEALKELRTATELAPTDPLLFYSLGEAYMEVGENDKGLAEFQKASEMGKLNYELHAQLEKVYTQLGLFDLAQKEHEMYLKAMDILSGGRGEQSPGSMFKAPEYRLPETAAPAPDSVRSGGAEIPTAPVLQR